MRQLERETKLRLLAYCVASQITSLSFHSDRDRQLAQIAGAAQIDMADKWEPNQAFYDQLSKATLLKLLAEGCGNNAVENCHTMKRSEEHTSELQSLMRISYAVFCLKKKK